MLAQGYLPIKMLPGGGAGALPAAVAISPCGALLAAACSERHSPDQALLLFDAAALEPVARVELGGAGISRWGGGVGPGRLAVAHMPCQQRHAGGPFLQRCCGSHVHSCATYTRTRPPGAP